ncbi:NADH-ubiquinone oxidoreductase chain 2, partial [Armadillidium vulgare]
DVVCREPRVKYFLVQACASFLLFFRGVRIINYIGVIKRLITISLLIKLGAAPFYFWYLWVGNRREVLIYLSIIVGGVVGGIGGVRISWIAKLTLFVSFLSLGGLPPLLGFFPKFIVIEIRSGRSVITLFYYLRARLSVLILNYRKVKFNFTFSEKFSIILILIGGVQESLYFSKILELYILYLGFEQGLLELPLE